MGKSGQKVFSGSGLTDPVTGRALDDIEFSYSTYENGPATTRTGVEFASKTAFTFLPSVLRHTGLDLNYTKVKSSSSEQTVRDLITGDLMPIAGEPRYSYNASLWYDDGAFSARVAVQAVAMKFICLAACYNVNLVNNYPADGAGSRITTLSFNPGSPNFRDATRYIDAKVAYKFKNGVEVFAEGRNLGKATTSQSQNQYTPFADGTPNMLDYAYAGRRIMLGVNIKL